MRFWQDTLHPYSKCEREKSLEISKEFIFNEEIF